MSYHKLKQEDILLTAAAAAARLANIVREKEILTITLARQETRVFATHAGEIMSGKMRYRHSLVFQQLRVTYNAQET